MKEYERLTERSGKAICIKETSTNDSKSIWNAIERLAELEDKIENGTLIELPCKVGDNIWWISSNNRDIIEVIVNSIRLVKDRIILLVEEKGVGEYSIMFVDDIFLNKAEAEKKLKELKGEV